MISGTTIAVTIFVIIMVSMIMVYRRPYFDDDDVQQDTAEQHQKKPYGRMLSFNIVNNSEETLELDLCNLDESNPSYSFFTSDGNYKKLVEYLKSYSLNVIGTKVQYDNGFWQKDIIKTQSYSPFDSITKPIFVAIDDFDLSQERLIVSKDKYRFDYFNTLLVKLKPKERKNIILLISEDELHNEEMPVLCGICVNNNSDTAKRVPLFVKNKIEEVEITSLFDSTDYQTILNMYDSRPLIASKIRIYAQNNTKGVLFKINNNDTQIAINKESYIPYREYYDIEMEPLFIAKFDLEVEAKSQAIIVFK